MWLTLSDFCQVSDFRRPAFNLLFNKLPNIYSLVENLVVENIGEFGELNNDSPKFYPPNFIKMFLR